jgi:hypothetical protein
MLFLFMYMCGCLCTDATPNDENAVPQLVRKTDLRTSSDCRCIGPFVYAFEQVGNCAPGLLTDRTANTLTSRTDDGYPPAKRLKIEKDNMDVSICSTQSDFT